MTMYIAPVGGTLVEVLDGRRDPVGVAMLEEIHDLWETQRLGMDDWGRLRESDPDRWTPPSMGRVRRVPPSA